MEQSDRSQFRLNTGRILLIIFAVLMLGAIVRHYTSGLAKSARDGGPFTIAVLTNPPALAELTPDKGRVRFSIVKEPSAMAENDSAARAEAILSAAPPQAYCGNYYFKPSTSSPETVWAQARETALNYRARPQLALAYLKDYVSALKSGRTNIAPDDFYIITNALVRAKADSYIAVLNSSLDADAAVSTKTICAGCITDTLTIEVLNGSGVPGLALDVTRFIRSMAGPEFKVDVLRHDSSARTGKTHFVAYTSREDDLAKLSARLGTGVEIKSSHSDIGDTDARLILGTDFKLPR